MESLEEPRWTKTSTTTGWGDHHQVGKGQCHKKERKIFTKRFCSGFAVLGVKIYHKGNSQKVCTNKNEWNEYLGTSSELILNYKDAFENMKIMLICLNHLC